MRIEHEPKWVPADLRIDSEGNTRPGYICVHQLENGMGTCGGNVFSLDQVTGKHTCWIPERFERIKHFLWRVRKTIDLWR